MLVWVLLLTELPLNLVSDDVDEILEDAGLVMNVQAAELSEWTETSYTFTSGDGRLSEYSQCFQDADWAATHANDTLILNPNAGKFVFDADYNPIGNASAPFYGTIILTTSAEEYAIETHTPIFDYVMDSVSIVRSDDSKKIPLNINRVADVGDTVSPLMAKHVVGSGAAAPYDWMVTLNAASATSYSGVIYEMAQGAKVNLTFVDNSNHEAKTDANGNISTGSIIDNKQDSANYGILCGAVKDGSVLQAKYTNTNNTEVTFIGTGTAYCGGLIGEINNSTFELLSGSSALKVDFKTAKERVGFICGHAEDSTITLPEGYTFSGTVFGNEYAGGIAGYCKNTVINFGSTTESITEGISVNITESKTVGTIESTTQGAIEGTPESITGSVTEDTDGSASEGTTESVTEGTPGSTAGSTSEGTTENKTEGSTGSTSESTPENKTEDASESTTESITEGTPGSTSEGTPESTPEGTTEIIPNSSPESTSEGTSGPIALNGCTIKNGSDARATGGVFGYYECDTAANDILIGRKYTLTNYTLESGNRYSGGIAGEYVPNYTEVVTVDLDKYSLGDTINLSGTTTGGLFGKYTANGNVTITDTDNSTPFTAPSSNTAYGGVIGEYVNSDYGHTLTLSDFTVNGLSSTSTGSVGGVISVLNGATYVSVSNVSVTNVSANDASYFGGIISKLDDNNVGSFIDVTGNFTLSMASGTYKGGAIAGSFKTGVIRLAGITDISGAKAANGYAQLVYENDETLVYALGSGSDGNWMLKRNADTTASDLGQWGEVVRLFNGQNAEIAGIVTFSDNIVTIASVNANPSIDDAASFAKVALNMQLNDGNNHGALCFAEGGVDKTSLLSSTSFISVSGSIDLAGTGLLGLMRDGGNGKYLKSGDNTFQGNPDFFTGRISGSDESNDKILLAVGEAYGCDANGIALSTDATGGRIYLSENWGHDAQGLVSFGKGASFSNITIGGTMHVSRVAGSNHLYMAPMIGAMTNGATLTNVIVETQMTADRANNAKFYVGGVSGVFDGNVTGENSYSLSIVSSIIKPTINLTGSVSSDNNYENNNTYAGGILGLLKGAAATQYSVSITGSDNIASEVSPTIIIDSEENPNYSFVGGMIGRVAENKTNERTISINNVTMNNASVETKAKYPGGLLGSHWERTLVTIDRLTITGSSVSHKYSSAGSKQSGLVFKGSGKWDINSLSINSSQFTSTDTKPASFGLIVNEAYSGDDGLFIDLKNRGYILTDVTVPVSSSDQNYYVDEIAADTKNNDKDNGDILAGGNGTGIINVNMNTADGTNTKITETGTYQNQLYSQLENLVANQNSRYYYNIDVMLNNGTKGSSATGGEQFLLWSVRKYAASNIKGYFKNDDTMISSTGIDLTGLSYYPIAGGGVTLPENATITFGFKGIKEKENIESIPDNWARQPDDTGNPNTENARNQHYLMQTGLFTTASKLTANTLTLKGDFGYVEGVASGALINGKTSGSVTLTELTLNGLKPSDAASYMLINNIDGTGTATPNLNLSNLRVLNYGKDSGITLPVAKSLFGTATGQNMTMTFSDIKLDARDGKPITDASWTDDAATAMTNAYGTNRSIFSDAIFFTSLLAATSCNMEYNYTVDEDWGTGTLRAVTYGKEVTLSKQYQGGERKYYTVGDTVGNYTNPISNNNTAFDFSQGFLPYVSNYEDKGKNKTYPVVEIKVNYKAPGLTEGCGTYNDPYIISSAEQLETVANAINGTSYPSKICLPNTFYANHVSVSWHDETKGCGNYELSGINYNKASTNGKGLNNGTWTQTRVRYYLAAAYYKIEGTITLSESFEGIGKPNNTSNTYKGNTVFHGVIVGDSKNKPTINNPTGNPLIVVSNGAVIKNININVTGDVSRTQSVTGDSAVYGYDNTKAQYYGGVIGEIMGGDNIIDDVTVTYSGSTTLAGDYKYLIAEGGMVGAVVNGALIFRGSNTVGGRNVTGGGIYSNPYVGRVINGYAIYEKIDGRTGTAPDNGDNYHIDTIDRSNTNKLDVNYNGSTISVPDAQALYIMSLITQSIAGTAQTSGNNDYAYDSKVYSPSYGYKDYMNGVARLADYSDVGCGKDKSKENYDDYASYAYLDSVNNCLDGKGAGLCWAPIPYIIYKYTKRYVIDDTTSTKPALDFPARKMTSDNTKFWDITLAESETFKDFDDYKAFRGIGSVGVITKDTGDSGGQKTSMKVATFNGNGNTINLHISLPRYERNIENYYHKQPTSLTQTYSGDDLGHGKSNYASESNLQKLMGLGLFDCVLVKKDENHQYQFIDFTLQGTVEDKVYNSSGADVTGQTDNGQLFCVGGVVGKRVNGNNYDINFKDITFDGLTITGSFNCGGLIGHDAVKNPQEMKIEGCSSTANGITVIGGHFDEYSSDSERFRNGIGSLVGMTFWCRPYIDGKTTTSDVSEIKVHKVSTFYTAEAGGVNAGGLIGYSGTGAEIKNIRLVGANDDSVIGAPNALNAAGFIAFAQLRKTDATDNDSSQSIILENCTLYHLSVQAKRSAAGLYGRSWNSQWSVKYININNCAVIGEKGKHEIRAYGNSTDNVHDCVGGFISGCAGSDDNEFSVIQNSYIEGYSIEGYNVGGIIGRTTYKPAYLKNLYVKDCDIVINRSSGGNEGGIVGYSTQNLSGYNLATYNVNYLKRTASSTVTPNTNNAGFILGGNDSKDRKHKFIGIGAYHTADSNVPVNVVKTNNTNTSNFFVYADYLSESATDITAKKGYSSSFGLTNANSAGQPSAPFVNVAPHMTVGSSEYLTGDGASVGKAGEIYKVAVAKENTSNRRYSIGSTSDASTGKLDSEILAKYINDGGTYIDGAFKISTAFDQFGNLPSGVQNFAMLVINDDSAKAEDITPFIKSYIRLVTNAAGSCNTNSKTSWYHRDAYSCGNNDIDPLYQVVINPCYYDDTAKKFVLGTAGDQGLQMYALTDTDNHGKYYFDSEKADSASSNPYQFSLIDVQFKDPTDTTGTKIAYHLYVPVYTKKIPAVDFSAVSMSETRYYRSNYTNRIYSEINAGKTANNPSQLVESTNEWTTTFIRYTYPKNQIDANADWNFDKSITLTLDANFRTLPIGTKMILVDPNANADKFYTYTINAEYATNTAVPLPLSSFVDESGKPFAPQSLSKIMASAEATSAAEGHTNDLYEDYYISIYVPKNEGYTHSIIVGCGTEMSCTGRDDKANITSRLYSRVVLGDLFTHSVEQSFIVVSGDGTTYSDSAEMTATNHVLKTQVTATVQIKDRNAGNYLAGSDVYHSFFITLTSHDADQKVSDIIYGINSVNISNTTTYSYSDSTGDHTKTVNESFLGANYIQLNTGNILDALYDSQSAPEVKITSETTMSFYDVTAFPYNLNKAEHIGTQVSVKSSLAYREEDLLYSAMNITQQDPEGKFYYSTTQNSAELSFNAVPTDDVTDEIGLKTNNKSLLGVNGKYGTSHPIIGLAIYNVDDIIDYDSATEVVYKITLHKKVTDENGTRYVKVSDISKYLSDVKLTDDEVELTADKSYPSEYVYKGPINHNQQIDLDKMFDVDFSCNVLTGDANHNEYANYKIQLTAELVGASNSWKDSFIIYTNAKFDPSVIDEL